jgi:hypothetical protein
MIKNLLSMTLSLAITGSILGITNQEIALKIALIGDSTVTDAAGWGKAFAGRFEGNVNVINYAVGGRSS